MDRPAPAVAQPSSKKATVSNVEHGSTETQVTSEQQSGDTVEGTPNKDTPTDDTRDLPSSREGTDEQVTEKGKESLEILAKEKEDVGKEKEDLGKEKEEVEREEEDLGKEKEDVGKVMAELTRFIYNYPGYDLGPIKTRAILCHIYYLAINDKWFQARDLMLMSHLQEGIQFADVPTQVSHRPMHPVPCCFLACTVVADPLLLCVCVCAWSPCTRKYLPTVIKIVGGRNIPKVLK